MQNVILKQAPEVMRIIKAAFPGYKKHSAYLSEFGFGVTINSFWDGGSKAFFVLIDLATLQTKELPTASHPYFDLQSASGENQDVIVERGCVTLKRLPEGIALVEGGTFCGKQATAHVYLNPANLTKMLAEVAQ